MLGDFNEILSSQDKLGGNSLNPRRVQLFKECLDTCGMVDLGFHGPRFTLVNKREAGYYIQERLDKGFGNADWRELYPEIAIHHLARIHSDHCLLLLKLDNSSSTWCPRPFLFQPMWMSHPLFPNVVTDAWTEKYTLKRNFDFFID